MIKQTSIISGKMKGRKLRVPQYLEVRPTQSVVRAALFNILGDFVVGSTLVDCFAGTGSVGLEALSRGAKKVIFFEKNYECVQFLQKKIQEFSLEDRATVFYKDASKGILHKEIITDKLDWVYLDPPYGSSLSKEVAMSCIENKIFVEDGLIIFEQRSKENLVESLGEFSLWKSREYGCSRLDFYKFAK